MKYMDCEKGRTKRKEKLGVDLFELAICLEPSNNAQQREARDHTLDMALLKGLVGVRDLLNECIELLRLATPTLTTWEPPRPNLSP